MRTLIALLITCGFMQVVFAQSYHRDTILAQSRQQESVTNKSLPATPQTTAQPNSTSPKKLTDLNLGLGLSISTAGFGGHLSIPIQPDSLNARIGLNYFSYSYSGQADDVDFSFKLGMQSYDALLDWFPFEGSFRLTAGMIYNANKITATGRPNIAGQYIVNGHHYHANDVGSLKGSITFPSFVPYLGFGFGNTSKENRRWSIFSDTGILLNSAPSAKIQTSNCSASPAVCANLDNDLGELNKSLNDTFRLFKIYPVIRVGIAYRF